MDKDLIATDNPGEILYGAEDAASDAGKSEINFISEETQSNNTAKDAQTIDTPPVYRENEDGSSDYVDGDVAADYTDGEAEEVSDGDELANEDGEDGASFKDDLVTLINEFPELSSKLSEGLVNTERYAKLRALGLTPTEAYLATSRSHTANNRSHLVSSVPAGAKSPSGGMSKREMREAKALFEDLSEREIIALYNRVTRKHG